MKRNIYYPIATSEPMKEDENDRLIIIIIFEDCCDSGNVKLQTIGIYSKPNDEIKERLHKFMNECNFSLDGHTNELFSSKIDTMVISKLFEGDDIIDEKINVDDIDYPDDMDIDIYSIPLDKLYEFKYDNWGGY